MNSCSQIKRKVKRMNDLKAYLVNSSVELDIRGFFNQINSHGIPALMCLCYAKAFDSMEEIPASMIEIR